MKRLKQILMLENTTINSPKKVVEYLSNHYDVRYTEYHYMEDSLTYFFELHLTFWAKLKYLLSNKYRIRVKVTFDEAVSEIPQEFRVITKNRI